MRRLLRIGMATLALAGCSTGKVDVPEDFSNLAGQSEKSDAFSSRMMLLGSLSYGQTSDLVAYHNPPRFAAFKFTGSQGDAIDLRVHSTDGDALTYLTDSNFNEVSHNDDADGSLDSHIAATLPSSGTYYVIFRDYSLRDAGFTVALAGPPPAAAGKPCGGFLGLACPAGQVCVDDPHDSCDPNNGGADCAGTCASAGPTIPSDAQLLTDGATFQGGYGPEETTDAYYRFSSSGGHGFELALRGVAGRFFIADVALYQVASGSPVLLGRIDQDGIAQQGGVVLTGDRFTDSTRLSAASLADGDYALKVTFHLLPADAMHFNDTSGAFEGQFHQN